MLRHAALPTLFALLVLAGCVGFVPAHGDTTTESSTARTTEPPPKTTVETPPPTDCGTLWVAFYAVGTDVQNRLWDPDTISIGYTVPGNASVFFVAYENGTHENGTVLGAEHVEHNTGYGVTADGAPVELDRTLSGEHTVSVVAHADADGDDEFDRRVDPACLNDGELVQAGPSTFDFDEFADEETADEKTTDD